MNRLDHCLHPEEVKHRGAELVQMAEWLMAHGALDAGEETGLLLVASARMEGGLEWDREEVQRQLLRLRGVWRAERLWRLHGQRTDRGFLRALADYRGVELPECERCGGSGVVMTGASQRSCTSPDCVGGRDVSRMREPGEAA